MINYIDLFESGDESFTLRLALETVSFDFNASTRTCRIYIYANNAKDNSVTVASGGKIGNLQIFGKTFLLSESFTANIGDSTIFDTNEIVIDNNSYKNSADYLIKLCYENEDLGLKAAEIGGKINFPEMPSPINFALSCGTSVNLGENITVNSKHFKDGFGLKVTFYDGNLTIYSKELSMSDNVFYSNPKWASRHPDESSFTLRIKVVPIFNGVLLETEKSVNIYCSLPSESSGPTGAITTELIYDDDVDFDFGVPIVNRCIFRIAVSNVTCYYGASIVSQAFKFNGSNTANASAVNYSLTTTGRKNWSVILTDSRGFSRTYNGYIDVYNYAPPDFDATVERFYDEVSGEDDIKFRITPIREYTFNDRNNYSYAYRFRNCADGIFSGWIASEARTDVRVYANMARNEVYEIEIKAEDSVGLSLTKSYTVKCERTDLHIGRNRLGIGKKATEQNKVECAWDIKCDGDISFKDGEGNDISLRAMASWAASSELPNVKYVVRNAYDNAEITNIVNNILRIIGNYTMCILALCVEEDGLSLSKGVHFYIVYNDGENSGYIKL